MKTTELRIGNYIRYRTERDVIVQSLGYRFETGRAHDLQIVGSDDIREYNPIPLTEEWLLKFGWFKEDYMNYCSEEPTEFCIPMMRIVNFKPNEGETMFMCNKNGVRLKHVHQLQNLYFALTGKELKLKQ